MKYSPVSMPASYVRWISTAAVLSALPTAAFAQTAPTAAPAPTPPASAAAPNSPPGPVPPPVNTPPTAPSSPVAASGTAPPGTAPPGTPTTAEPADPAPATYSDSAPTTAPPAPTSSPLQPAVPGETVPGEVPPAQGTVAPLAAPNSGSAAAEVDGAAPETSADATRVEPAAEEDSEPFDPDSIDLDALLGSGASDASVMADLDAYRLNIYGFADFAYTKTLSGDMSFGRGFAVGNLNVYIGAELGDGWRALSEVRFTYLPHGSYALTAEAFTEEAIPLNTTVGDYADYSRPLRWGGIEIERAWLEYSFTPWLALRGGSWLTPYGIWNVDHGSPVIVGTVRPFIVGEEFFPERQTGLQLHGGTQVGPTELGYALTVSNGRGPYDTHLDMDDNLGVGGRFFARYDSDFGLLSVGASAYTGRFTDSVTAYEAPTFLPVEDVRWQFDETSVGVDLKYEYENFLFQSEAITNAWVYTDTGRPEAFVFDGTQPGFEPDARRWGAYALTGYRTPWLNTMPWLGAEVYDSGTLWKGRSAALLGGLNLRPTPRVVLKAQITHSWFYDNQDFLDGANALVTQAAWSF